MKRIVYVLIYALLLAATLPAFAIADEPDADFDASAFMLSAARELTADMRELAADKTLVSLFGSSEGIMSVAADIGDADFDSVTKAYVLSGNIDNFASQFGEAMLTERQNELLGGKLSPVMLLSYCNSSSGAEWLATATILNTTYNYYRPGFPDMDYLVVLETAGEYSSGTAFYLSGDDGVVSASTMPVMSENLPALLEAAAQIQWGVEEIPVN